MGALWMPKRFFLDHLRIEVVCEKSLQLCLRYKRSQATQNCCYRGHVYSIGLRFVSQKQEGAQVCHNSWNTKMGVLWMPKRFFLDHLRIQVVCEKSHQLCLRYKRSQATQNYCYQGHVYSIGLRFVSRKQEAQLCHNSWNTKMGVLWMPKRFFLDHLRIEVVCEKSHQLCLRYKLHLIPDVIRMIIDTFCQRRQHSHNFKWIVNWNELQCAKSLFKCKFLSRLRNGCYRYLTNYSSRAPWIWNDK